jgi:hydroxymethylbilane synthase
VKLRLGTRGSPLAVAQSSQIARALEAHHPGLEVELVCITTTGDTLQQSGNKPESLTKAVFTKEIEEALLDGRIDLAVHSSKDLAATLPEGLDLGAFPARASSADVLVSREGLAAVRARECPQLATGSARRRLQWSEVQPGAVFHALRGNIDTRLRRLRETAEWDGIILAAAGLGRLEPDLAGLQVDPLPFDWMLPAPGQGALAVQVRADDARTREWVAALDDRPTRQLVEAERALLSAMGAGCDIPLGAVAEYQDGTIRLRAAYYPPGQVSARRGEARGDDPRELGHRLAEVLLR